MTQYIKDLYELFESDNRNTTRKRVNTLKAEIAYMQDIIDFVQPQLDARRYVDVIGTYGLHLGEKVRELDLYTYNQRIKSIRREWDKLIIIDKR